MLVTKESIESLAWQKMNDLIPAIIQHHATGAVLMQGYMSKESLTQTLDSEKATFFSRSKQALWVKGETSGHFLLVKQVLTDCDQDSLLVLCEPIGPSCHLGTESCFAEQPLTKQNFLSQLEQVIASRKNDAPEQSYTAPLVFARHNQNSAKSRRRRRRSCTCRRWRKQKRTCLVNVLTCSIHTLVLLQDKNIALNEVMEVLIKRHQK